MADQPRDVASVDASVADFVDADGFSFAFQPIVDIRSGTAYSHEALVRGLANESAWQVLERHAGAQATAFDGACRARAIEVACRIGVDTHLNLNFIPSAAAGPRFGLESTIEAARHHGFPLDRIIVEATETEAISDHAAFAASVKEHRRAGLQFAIDDFGAGYSGLNLLAEFQPDMVKLDMALVRGIESHGPRQAIMRAIHQVCVDLGIDVVVEGVETVGEFAWCRAQGIHLYQGYLFAKPMFETMPAFEIPDLGGPNPPL